MKYLKTYKAIIIAAVVLVILSLLIFRKSKPTQIENNRGIVQYQDLTQRVTISGQIWPRKRLDIRPPFHGYIEKFYVKVGEKVKAGTALVTFSPSLGRGETNFPVRASFNGVVTQILKTEGEYVTETGEQNLIMRVEDLDDLYVLASSPELDIAKLKIGQEAQVRISSLLGETFVGHISEMYMSAKDKDRYSSNVEFQLRVSLKSRDPRLLPGMSTLMDIVTNKASHVLTLPHEYIEEKDGQYFVTTVSGQKKNVELGLQTEEAAEIKSGLNEGEEIKLVDFLHPTK